MPPAARTTQDPRLRGHVRSACGSRRRQHHSPHWRHAPSGTFAGPAALSLHGRRPHARTGTLRLLRPPSPSHAPPTCRCRAARPASTRTRHHGATRAAHATSCTDDPAHTPVSARTWRVGVALVVSVLPLSPLRWFQTRLSPRPLKTPNPNFKRFFELFSLHLLAGNSAAPQVGKKEGYGTPSIALPRCGMEEAET